MTTKPIIVPCTKEGLEKFFEKKLKDITIIDLLIFNKLIIDYRSEGTAYWYQIHMLEFEHKKGRINIITVNTDTESINAHKEHEIDLSKDYAFYKLST